MTMFKELKIGQRFFIGKNIFEKIEVYWAGGEEYNAVCRKKGNWQDGDLRWFDGKYVVSDKDLIK